VRCTKRRTDGEPCQRNAIAGTDACPKHVGTDLATAKAKGAVVVELSKWGLTDRTLDPGETLLRLMTQAVYRAEHYSRLLEEAYEAAERLRVADDASMHDLPPNADTRADRDRAVQDLARVFATGGIAALIGHTYSADKEGGVFATGEAIRGLVQLEAQERDRAAMFATKALAAGIAERQVRLAESQGALLAERGRAYIAGVIDALGLDQAAAAPVMQRLFADMLRSLAGGPLQVTA
jgi:hypothetical protein